MQDAKISSSWKFQLAVITMLFSSACGIKGTNTSCATGTAQITVTDGTISRDCGCTEGAGTFSAGATNFQCTLTVNTRLYVEFNTATSHRITIGTSSPLEIDYAPNAGDPNPAALTFSSTTSGSGAAFADSQTSITGSFIVNP